MARTQKQIIKTTEEWLDERYNIMRAIKEASLVNTCYYEGALQAIEFLGYEWSRDKSGKHKLCKI